MHPLPERFQLPIRQAVPFRTRRVHHLGGVGGEDPAEDLAAAAIPGRSRMLLAEPTPPGLSCVQ
jgi:hypothetical protein